MSNTIVIAGHVGGDPDLKYLPSGAAVCEFSLASNRTWKDKNGEKQEETSWFRVVCWQNLAENVAESITSGTRIVVTGHMKEDRWETDEGSKRSVLRIQADEVAPSLRFATAQITRIQRGSGGEGE